MLPNVLVLYVLQGINYLAPLFAIPYLVRVLGADQFGVLAYAQAFVQFFVVLTEYGFNFSATRQVALQPHDSKANARLFGAVVCARALLASAGFIIFMLLIYTVDSFSRDWPVFLICYLAVLGSVISPLWLFQGLERMVSVTIIAAISKSVMLVGLLIWVRSPDDAVFAAGIQAASTLIAAILGVLALRAIVPLGHILVSWSQIKTVLREGQAVFASSLAINLYTSGNTVILGLLTNSTLVGYYSAAEKVLRAVIGLIVPVSQALYPRISMLHATDRPAALLLIRRAAGVAGGVFVAVFLLLMFKAEELVLFLYGDGYSDTAELLMIMSPVPALVALGTCYSTLYMLGGGYTVQWRRIITTTVFVNFASLALLASWLEAPAAVAMTLVIDEAWVLAASYWFWRRHAIYRTGDA